MPTATGLAPVNVASSNRVYKRGGLSAAAVNGGSQAHLALRMAASFTLNSDLELTGCTLYTTPFDGGIAVGTRIGIASNLVGLTSIPWLASGLSTVDPGQGVNPVTVYFENPVMLQAGVTYCITGDCDIVLSSGVTNSGILQTNANVLTRSNGSSAFAVYETSYRIPFQLFGFVQPRKVTGSSPVSAPTTNKMFLQSTAPVKSDSSSYIHFSTAIPTGMAPVTSGSSSGVRSVVTSLAPVDVYSLGRTRARLTSMAPVNVESSSVLERRVTGLAPVTSGSSNLSYRIVDFEVYLDEAGAVQIPFEFSGIMDPLFPPPVPPVNFDGLPDPTVAPTLAKSNTANGHLAPGTYRYSYAAWKGSQAQATAPSPTADITLSTEDTVILTYPTIAGADGYLVYREDL